MSCPANVTQALATLPWVEADSIKADRNTRQVKFTVKDRAKFDFEEAKRTLSDEGYSGAKMLTEPTEK